MISHREDQILHGDPRIESWWIERSSSEQALKCELFLMVMIDF